jgi:hypothetical protein
MVLVNFNQVSCLDLYICRCHLPDPIVASIISVLRLRLPPVAIIATEVDNFVIIDTQDTQAHNAQALFGSQMQNQACCCQLDVPIWSFLGG